VLTIKSVRRVYTRVYTRQTGTLTSTRGYICSHKYIACTRDYKFERTVL